MGIRKPNGNVRRPHSKKDSKTRTLIVCGAEQSEKNYLECLIGHHKINSSTVKIFDFPYTPERLVIETQAIAKAEVKLGEKFDHVFCIVDRDDFAHFNRAKAHAAKLNYVYIESHPCFEYWLLIHFKPTDMPFAKKGELSVGDVCYKELRSLYKGYEKNSKKVYVDLLDRMDGAIRYAERTFEQAKLNNEYNPSSNFYLVVRHLLSMAGKP